MVVPLVPLEPDVLGSLFLSVELLEPEAPEPLGELPMVVEPPADPPEALELLGGVLLLPAVLLLLGVVLLLPPAVLLPLAPPAPPLLEVAAPELPPGCAPPDSPWPQAARDIAAAAITARESWEAFIC